MKLGLKKTDLNKWMQVINKVSAKISSVQSLSRVQLFATPWTAARQASLSITNSGELGQTHVHQASDAIQPDILSSVVPFSSCLQSCPASGSFPISQFCTSGAQSMGVSASTSVLPMNIQDWFPLDGLVGSPCSPGDFQESSPTLQFKCINFLALSFLSAEQKHFKSKRCGWLKSLSTMLHVTVSQKHSNDFMSKSAVILLKHWTRISCPNCDRISDNEAEFSSLFWKGSNGSMLLLSCFSRVRLCATP